MFVCREQSLHSSQCRAYGTNSPTVLCADLCIKRGFNPNRNSSQLSLQCRWFRPWLAVGWSLCEFMYQSNTNSGTNINILQWQIPHPHSHLHPYIFSTLILSWMMISFIGSVWCDSLWAVLSVAHSTRALPLKEQFKQTTSSVFSKQSGSSVWLTAMRPSSTTHLHPSCWVTWVGHWK